MRRLKRTALAVAIAALAVLGAATSAAASQRGPELKLVVPDSVEAGESATMRTFIFNNTGQRFGSPITIAWSVSGDAEVIAGGPFESSAGGDLASVKSTECSPPGGSQTCTIALTPLGLAPGIALSQREPPPLIAASPSASGELVLDARLSVPGAPAVEVERTISVGPPLSFGIEEWKMPVFGSDESQRLQAGSTPSKVENTLRFTTFARSKELGLRESIKDAVVHLPPGWVGNPQAVPYCHYVDFARFLSNTPDCPRDTQVGIFKGVLTGQPLVEPLFNIEPAPGEPARFGFNFASVPTILDAHLRQGDYGVDVSSTDVNTTLTVQAPEFEFWGVPGDPRYDGMGGLCLGSGGAVGSNGETCPASIGRTSFLRLPTHCTGEPLRFPLEMDTWEHPDVVHSASFDASPVQDCDNVPFDPDLSVVASSVEAESPTGLRAEVEVPNQGLENPEAISESDVKEVKVALPQGVTLNPSQAEGLEVCAPAQYKSSELSFHPDGTKGCPSDSKIGTVEVHSPVLEETIPGNVYVAKPYDNPFDSLLAIYVVLEEPMRGILVKLAGKVEPDERTGRIVTTFSDLPQLPFTSFEFRFREGARAPLVTPPTCGTYTTEAEFTPWANPNRKITKTTSFQITRGIGGGPCPSAGLPPFKPGLQAGALNNRAGAFSPFNVRLFRTDSEQEFTNFSIKLPPGILGKLAGVGSCSDAAIAAAKLREGSPTGGQEEIERPSCPASSLLGRTLAGAGVGSVLTYAPGKIYLAGPYHGSAISLVSITAAKVGPFDLGTVVVRFALRVNPETAEIFIDPTGSDPIPHIIKGVTVHLRDIRSYVDRPEFTLNPTSCERTSTASTLLGSGLDFSSSADDLPVTVATPFQAADCGALTFKPKLTLGLRGATKRAGNPALRAVLTKAPGEANLARVQVTLPKSEFLDNAHIGTVCTRVQFNAGAHPGDACPPKSVYGAARVFSPLIDYPLEGPLFLRSNPERELPDLVAALHGAAFDIVAVGNVDSVKGGGIRTTFANVPDAPLSKVILTMAGRKKGLLENSTNLCANPRATVKLDAHNGKTHDFNPLVKADCGKGKRTAHNHNFNKRSPR
jgi:hypothetical protein